MREIIKTVHSGRNTIALETIFREDTEKDNIEFLRNLAIEILTEFDNLKETPNTSIKKRLFFFTLYTVTYLFATINLLGVARSADFNDAIDIFKKFSLIILASLAPGFMYLGGMQELIEVTENYFKGLEKRLPSYLNKIRNSLVKAHGRDYFKMLVIGLFAVLSTTLDATNAKTGVEAIAGKTAGIIAGVGNGIAESILPLFTLEALFRSIGNNFKALYLGSQYEEEEFDNAVTIIEGFINQAGTVNLSNPQNPISAVLKNMDSAAQLAIAKLMRKIQDSSQFAQHLSHKIKGENPNLSNLRLRTLAAGSIVANFLLSYCSAWIFSRGFSSTQIVSHYETELSRHNLTLDNLDNVVYYYLAQNNTDLDIEPFNFSINALNQLSYALQGIAFLPLINQTFSEVGNLLRFILNFLRFILNSHDRTNFTLSNLKKTLFASGIAGIGTACYVMLGLDAKKNYKILQQLLKIEKLKVPEISFLPDFNLLPCLALSILVAIIFGGAFNAAKKSYDVIFPKTISTDEKKERKYCSCQFFSSSKKENKEQKENLSPQDVCHSLQRS